MRPLLIYLTAFFLLPIGAFLSHAQTPSAPYAATSLSQFSTPDTLWMHIQDLKKGPKTRPTSAQEYRSLWYALYSQLYAATDQFTKEYPQDLRKYDARLLQIEAEANLQQFSSTRLDTSPVAAKFKALSEEMAAPGGVRAEARYQLLMMALQEHRLGNQNVTAAAILSLLNQFANDYPSYPSLDLVQYKVAEALRQSDPETAAALLKHVADTSQGQAGQYARSELETADKLKRPLDLHFTAVDGSQVDISSLRGKVVLVDFWATWCGPCRGEVPKVVDTYRKLHDRGFEVIGISLDQDKGKLVQFTAQNGMTWPQYFDGQGWNNSISSSFGIHGIPAMWLINKQGYVVSTNGRDNLEAQVEKLLTE